MKKECLLGFDIGTSSVKAALVDIATGECIAAAQYPDEEAPIVAPQPGWAEQDPEMWWDEAVKAAKRLAAKTSLEGVRAVGISYQMHGLVCVDREGKPVRGAIIWCDGRAVPYGEAALKQIGRERCMERMLNAPGNFTAAKLAWVKDQEPDNYRRIAKIMLPGDYIAMKLSGGEIQTTVSGLSEGILWDFRENGVSSDVMGCFGFEASLIPEIVPTFSRQTAVSAEAAKALGIPEGTPVTYRAGDQPNNALSLGVLHPGEVAATGGTSGVVYGVTDQVTYDPQSRVNIFAHVNHKATAPRLGVLLCINGTGILNSWMRRQIGGGRLSYPEMNELAATAPTGADGLSIIPFGNGAERLLGNRAPGAAISGIDFNRHTQAHLLRAAQEGIAFSMAYGMEVMEEMGLRLKSIRAGRANMFLSPLFRQTLATTTGAEITLYDTDGAAGAARGAGIGAGIYATAEEAFAGLRQTDLISPDAAQQEACRKAYERWREALEQVIIDN